MSIIRSTKSPICDCGGHCCPLCAFGHCVQYFQDAQRRYLSCADCGLVFVPERYWLDAEAERAVYDLHENDANDAGYRRFLSRLAKPLLVRLAAGQQGLDFGCGPGPTLSLMLEAEGHQVDLYDPYYFNNPSVFQKQYDFICATEVVEHLHHPGKAFAALFKMLNSGGWLAIMTKLVIDANAFSQWHYIRDLTHVSFFSRDTLVHVAQSFHADIDFIGGDVVLLQKK